MLTHFSSSGKQARILKASAVVLKILGFDQGLAFPAKQRSDHRTLLHQIHSGQRHCDTVRLSLGIDYGCSRFILPHSSHC
jgi:hypothetical protein